MSIKQEINAGLTLAKPFKIYFCSFNFKKSSRVFDSLFHQMKSCRFLPEIKKVSSIQMNIEITMLHTQKIAYKLTMLRFSLTRIQR